MSAYKLHDELLPQQNFSIPDEQNDKISNLDPVFSQAVETLFTLDDRGRRLNLEVNDLPYDALIRIAAELRAFGASNAVADFLVEAIESQAVQLGADFTRKEKPTPLAIRVMVTDKRPELEEGKVHFMVAFDRNRKHGAQYSTVEAHLTNTGTKLTTTNVPDLETMFLSGEKYLVIHFEKLAIEDLEGLDEVGVALTNLVEAAGPGVVAADLQELRTAIEQGNVTPEQSALINDLATLNRVVENVARAPVAVANAPQSIKAVREVVSQSLQNVTAKGNLPPVLLNSTIASFQKSEAVMAPSKPTIVAYKAPEIARADNNNTIAAVAKAPTAVVRSAEPAADAPVVATKSAAPVQQTAKATTQAPVQTTVKAVTPQQVNVEQKSAAPVRKVELATVIAKPAMAAQQPQAPQAPKAQQQTVVAKSQIAQLVAAKAQAVQQASAPVIVRPVAAVQSKPAPVSAAVNTPRVVAPAIQKAQAPVAAPVVAKSAPINKPQIAQAAPVQTKPIVTVAKPPVQQVAQKPAVIVPPAPAKPQQPPVNKQQPVKPQNDVVVKTVAPQQPKSQPVLIKENAVAPRVETTPERPTGGGNNPPRQPEQERQRPVETERHVERREETIYKPIETVKSYRAPESPAPTPYVAPKLYTDTVVPRHDTTTVQFGGGNVGGGGGSSGAGSSFTSSSPIQSGTDLKKSFSGACAGCGGGSCGACKSMSATYDFIPK